MFHPATQPRIDDPGETLAPQALEECVRAGGRRDRFSLSDLTRICTHFSTHLRDPG
jgi:hypothetical protein